MQAALILLVSNDKSVLIDSYIVHVHAYMHWFAVNIIMLDVYIVNPLKSK